MDRKMQVSPLKQQLSVYVSKAFVLRLPSALTDRAKIHLEKGCETVLNDLPGVSSYKTIVG